MSKPRINSKFVPVLNQVANYMQRSRLFGGSLSGGYNYADTKHDKSWKDYGWPSQIDFFMLWNMFRRNGFAFAGVTIPVEMCWLTKPWVQENDRENSDDETPYEKEFRRLAHRLKLWRVMRNADMMQRVGRYSGLYMVIADGQTPDQPLRGRFSPDKVRSIKPLFEGQLEPSQWEKNRASPRYGLPTYYTLNEGGIGNRDPYASDAGTIHHSRIIILSEDRLGSDIYGIPALEPGFNALLNLQKIQGAGGEGFWRQAAQRFVLEATDGGEGGDYTSEELTALSEMIADMFSGLDAIPALDGHKIVPLNTRMDNPKEYIESNLSEFAASLKGIPRKIISGTQTGVKAADEDTQGFMRLMQSRRENALCEMGDDIIEWFDTYTTLRAPANGATLAWDDLTAPTQMDRVELALKMVQSNRDNALSGSTTPIYTVDEIRSEAGFDALELDMDDMITEDGE